MKITDNREINISLTGDEAKEIHASCEAICGLITVDDLNQGLFTIYHLLDSVMNPDYDNEKD